MPAALRQRHGRDRGRALLQARRRRLRARSSAPASRTSSRARPCRAARRSPSSSSARSTSRTRSATSRARSARPSWRRSSSTSTRRRWILQNYLNDVPYGTVGGRTAIGVEAAAETFFAKHARDLTLAESALLAGLPQAPSQYNPFRNPSRRARAPQRGARARWPTTATSRAREADAAAQRAARAASTAPATRSRREPYFFDYVQEQLIEKLRRRRLPPRRAEGPHDDRPEAPGRGARRRSTASSPYPTGPGSAIVSIDPANGYIRAMASSGTYKDRTFNLAAQGHRQPGLGVQDVGADDGDPQGRRSRTDHLRLEAAAASTCPGYGHLGRQDLRRHLRRHR